jgi:hypothetical protein
MLHSSLQFEFRILHIAVFWVLSYLVEGFKESTQLSSVFGRYQHRFGKYYVSCVQMTTYCIGN